MVLETIKNYDEIFVETKLLTNVERTKNIIKIIMFNRPTRID